MDNWSDQSILKALPNPSTAVYEIQIKGRELTFLGVKHQPDFSTISLTIHPAQTIIELKSLKLYFQQFRNKIISYERLINVIYEDIQAVYKPTHLRIVMEFRPRGGLRSRLRINSGQLVHEDEK